MRGSAALPLTDEALMAKAMDCYGWVGFQADAGAQLAIASDPAARVEDFLSIARHEK
ncbi:hypothetical protein D9M70_560570 [compost metagenome]